MKKLIVLGLATLSISTMASTERKMNKDAVEMYEILTHPQVVECLKQAPFKMVNKSIRKNTIDNTSTVYEISGNKLEGFDTPDPEKTVIKIIMKLRPGVAGGAIKTFKCSIE